MRNGRLAIAVCGGGPAGLYFGLLARKRLGAAVTVHERDPRGSTYGFGIILADRGLERLAMADRPSHDAILAASYPSRDRVLQHRGERILIEGGGVGAAIARADLLTILTDHAERAGVVIRHGSALEEPPAADLVGGADGVNSLVRSVSEASFGVSRAMLTNKLAWYGTRAAFPSPILSFRRVRDGLFWAVAYSYSPTMSTFVAECDEAGWHAQGFAAMNEEERRARAEAIFAEELGGARLLGNRSHWHGLPVNRVREWHVSNRVLIGDALHSSHPSIGSGTRVAMEDAAALVEALESAPTINEALPLFRARREPVKAKFVEAMERSFAWYEALPERIDALRASELAFDYLGRTGRIGPARLAAEYPSLLRAWPSGPAAHAAIGRNACAGDESRRG